MSHILAADIGGTNSRFGIFEAEPGRQPQLRDTVWLRTHDAGSFRELLSMLPEAGLSIPLEDVAAAVFAVPGAVLNGSLCIPPNVAWNINLDDIPELKGRAELINDFAAQAFACRTDAVADALVIQQGKPAPGAATAVIGAGTGLGHSALIQEHGRYHAVPSEGGHMAFPFVGREEARFEVYARSMTGRNFCDGDTVVTGSGLSLIHRFLTGEERSPAEVAASLTSDSETCRWFARFYGRVARNWVLATVAWGGLFICGGVAAKNVMFVTCPEFLDEFHSFPKYQKVLAQMPIRLNTNEQSGLMGAALCAAQGLD